MAQEISVDIVQQAAGESSAMSIATLLLFPLMMMLILLPLRYFFTRARRNSKLPPSPPALPLIGHGHLIGSLPHVSLRDLARRHGGEDGLMLLRLGAVPTLVASSMRAAREVLGTHDRAFASRPRNVVSDVLLYGPSEVVFQPYGEGWRQARKLVTTHLLNTNKVISFRGNREEEARLLVDTIYSTAATCTPVDLSKLLSKSTNDIVCRAVAGRSVRIEGRDLVFRQLIDKTFTLLGGLNLDSFYPGLAKVAGGVLMLPARRKAEKLRAEWSNLLDKVINEHADEIASAQASHDKSVGGDKHVESDFIHVLLSVQEEYGLTRENIKAILFSMLAAGTDTSYIVLEYTMAELMLHQDVMAKLQAEVRKSVPNGQKFVNEEDLTRMTYLKAVIKETLRLHTPTPLLVPHISHENCEVNGYRIPAGTTLLINAWAICRDPMCWDAAEEFMPDRFIHMGETRGIDFRGRDFQFLPFGSGRRMCPGINYSLASMEIILANLLHQFDWELPKGVDAIGMTEVFRLTVCRKEKLFLVPRLHGTTQPLED